MQALAEPGSEMRTLQALISLSILADRRLLALAMNEPDAIPVLLTNLQPLQRGGMLCII